MFWKSEVTQVSSPRDLGISGPPTSPGPVLPPTRYLEVNVEIPLLQKILKLFSRDLSHGRRSVAGGVGEDPRVRPHGLVPPVSTLVGTNGSQTRTPLRLGESRPLPPLRWGA